MEFYSSLMGDNLAELVLQSPYPRMIAPGMSCGRLPGISRELPFSVRYTKLISPPDGVPRKPVIGVR